MTSAFGVEHDGISKAETRDKRKQQATVAAGVGAGAAGTTAVAMGTKLPEHSHYSKDTRKYIKSLPAGVHEVDTKMLAKKPRKLGARKQQTPYVAAMAQERPKASFDSSPVPITRYKDGVIQRDNAHSVMANAMKNRTTKIKIEDAPGYRPRRRTGEELVRRGQSRYQQRRLKAHTNLSDDAIEGLRSKYKEKSRIANTTKRPHGVVEDSFKMAAKPYNLKRAIKAGKNVAVIAKADKKRDTAAGVTGAAGVGVLASTPVRRSAAKVDIKDGQIKAGDAKKIVSPGYRPGNQRAIQVMSRNLGHLENKPTRVIQYRDGSVIPYDGNHRATARIARGDKAIPVDTIKGGERPAVSVTRNAVHIGQQKVTQARLNRGDFKPTKTTGKHSGETKVYRAIANGSKSRSLPGFDVSSTKAASGPTRAALRTKQGIAVSGGLGLLGTAGALSSKDKVKKSSPLMTDAEIKRRKKTQGRISQTTGALGLTSLGAFAASKAPGSARVVRLVPKLRNVNAKKMENLALGTSTAGAGIGGAGSFNFAAYTNAEGRKRKPVVKSLNESAFGVSHD